jgi:hypothetical protein
VNKIAPEAGIFEESVVCFKHHQIWIILGLDFLQTTVAPHGSSNFERKMLSCIQDDRRDVLA